MTRRKPIGVCGRVSFWKHKWFEEHRSDATAEQATKRETGVSFFGDLTNPGDLPGNHCYEVMCEPVAWMAEVSVRVSGLRPGATRCAGCSLNRACLLLFYTDRVSFRLDLGYESISISMRLFHFISCERSKPRFVGHCDRSDLGMTREGYNSRALTAKVSP